MGLINYNQYVQLKKNVIKSERDCIINNRSTTVLVRCIAIYLNKDTLTNNNEYNLLFECLDDTNLVKCCDNIAICIIRNDNDNDNIKKLNNVIKLLNEKK